MRVVLQHLLGELPGHGLDNVLGLTGLEQVRDDRVAQVVEPEAGQAVALSTSHTFSRSTSLRRTCFTSTPRIDVLDLGPIDVLESPEDTLRTLACVVAIGV